jgi:hypothetical protein
MLYLIAGLSDPDISEENNAFFLKGLGVQEGCLIQLSRQRHYVAPNVRNSNPSHIVTRLPTSTHDFITACTKNSTTLSYPWLVNISLEQCFQNMVAWNPRVPAREIIK